MTEMVDIFLAHYGVKGMKWGKRKAQDRSTESRRERKASQKALEKYMWEKTKNVPIFNVMTDDEYRKLSTGREFIEKGQILRRVTMDPKSIEHGHAYVSHLIEDGKFYRAAIPAVGAQVKRAGGGQKKYEQHYELQMKAVKKLSSPSDKERVDAFIELLDEPAVKIKDKKGNEQVITGRQYLEKHGYRMFKKLDTQKLGMTAWHEFAQGQGSQDSPLSSAYFDKIRKQGFNALPDDFDKGLLTKAPLILLDPSGTVKVTKVEKLTTDQINQAQRELKP